jgi:hypothetical protein
VGETAPNGVMINYCLKAKPTDEIQLKFFTERGDSVITYSSTKDKKGKALEINKDFYQKEKIERPGVINADAGLNTFVWDMRYADATDTEPSALMWSGQVTGPKVAPGRYMVELFVGKESVGKQSFDIKKDPRVETSLDDLVESAKFQLKVRDKLSETHKGINDLRQVRKQVSDYMNTVQDTAFKKDIEQISKPMLDALQKIEDELIQHKAKAFQDLLAQPIKLNDKLAGLSNVAASAEAKLTQSVQDTYNDISKAIDGHLKSLKKILDDDVPKFNQAAEGKKVPAIKVK